MVPVARWRIVAGGFLQASTELNGSVSLWRKCHQKLSAPDTVVQFVPWDTDPSGLAELILQLDGEQVPPDIRIAGFSWGGAFAARLAHELGRRGLEVRRLVLCDPVYRHRYFLGNWRAIFGVPIGLPDSVRVVDYLYQRQSWPQGHPIKCQGTNTFIRSAVRLDIDHVWCDDAPRYHELVLHVFGEP